MGEPSEVTLRSVLGLLLTLLSEFRGPSEVIWAFKVKKTSVSVLDKTHSLEKRKLFPTLVHLELTECGRAFA